LAMAQAFAAASSSSDAAGRPGRRAATPSSQRVYGWLVGWDERGNKVPKRAEHRRFVEAAIASLHVCVRQRTDGDEHIALRCRGSLVMSNALPHPSSEYV
jgi:hypothetical protein